MSRQHACCLFIVDFTQYRRYLYLPSLMVGKFYEPASIRRDKEPLTNTGTAQDWTCASIGVQPVDFGSTTTLSIEPQMTLYRLPYNIDKLKHKFKSDLPQTYLRLVLLFDSLVLKLVVIVVLNNLYMKVLMSRRLVLIGLPLDPALISLMK